MKGAGKSLSERIAARAAQRQPSRNAVNRAVFLALREDIKQAVDDGWPIKNIWQTLYDEGKVTFSYQAFRGYVNRLVLPPVPAGKTSVPAAGGDQQSPLPPSPKRRHPTVPGFTFNKNPDKEDLL